MGIRTNVLFLALTPAVLSAVVLVAYLTLTRLQGLEDTLAQRGEAIARQSAITAETAVAASDRDLLDRLARAVLQDPDVARVTIEGANGAVLVSVPGPVRAEGERSPGSAVATRTFRAPVYRIGGTEDSTSPHTTALAPRAAASIAAEVIGHVNVELSTQLAWQRRRDVITTGLGLALFCLVLAAILGRHMGRRISEPVLRLDNAVRELRNGRLDIHTPERSSGELGSLERGINAMAAALKASHEHLQEQVDEATAELRETMEELEIKNAEIDIARKKAIQASRVKSEFLANMSHEIRTPMNGVMGFIELLSKTSLNRTQQGYLQTLRASAENLMVLLNDILDFSKIEAGKFKIRQRNFDLREVLENAVLLFAANAQYKGINLILDIEPDVPSTMVGDAPRIAQIITNFVSNAVKFTDQGEVEVHVSKRSETLETVTLSMEIRDTGIGIAAQDQERLFNAFDQLDASTTRRHSGTGLGLAITQRLVSMMNGSIRVESQPGIGSIFYVSLVLKKQKPDPMVPNRDKHTDAVALLVSSDTLLTRAVTHILEYGGIRARYAIDLAAAADYLAATADIPSTLRGIILDHGDRLLTPDAFLARAKERGIGQHCALVLMEASEENPAVRRFTATFHTVYFANKPPTARELLTLLDANPQLPSERSAGAERPRDEDRVPIFGKAVKARVLLADDNLINRQLARIFLNQLGAQVDEAANGLEAVEACQHNRYDLILMDIHMPDMDGLEATQCIRTLADNANSIAPIIALTADAMNQERAQYMEAGMNDHLSKPITENALRRMLEKWCLGDNTQLAYNQ